MSKENSILRLGVEEGGGGCPLLMLFFVCVRRDIARDIKRDCHYQCVRSTAENEDERLFFHFHLCVVICSSLHMVSVLARLMLRRATQKLKVMLLVFQVFQGLLRAHKDYHDTKHAMTRLWIHECFRFVPGVFCLWQAAFVGLLRSHC